MARFNLPVKTTLAGALLCCSSSAVMASSFLILEQSPAHLGHAFAGTASNIGDATTVFFNPAGMSQLKHREVSVAGNVIFTEAVFNDRGSDTGGPEGKTDEIALVPNLYAVYPINDQWAFGIGINAPFGLASDYGEEWIGRYLATFSELQVINVNATFAYAVTEQLSVGLGVSYQHADVTLESQVDSTFGIAPAPASDNRAVIDGSDYAFVADVSVYYQPTDTTRLGLVWRQGADFTLEGGADFELSPACSLGSGYSTGVPPAPTTGTMCAMALSNLQGDAHAKVTLPDTLTFSISQQIAERWTLHSDIAWTEWSSIQTIEIINSNNSLNITQLDLEYKDTMRYALGVTYAPGSAWTWRAGVAWDETPQDSPQRVNPRIPDQDRTWISVGFNYAISEDISIDAGFAHLIIDDSHIDQADNANGHLVRGYFDSRVDIIGVQANWRF